METTHESRSAPNPKKWLLSSVFLAGAIFGSQSTAIYFLSGSDSSGPSNDSQQAVAALSNASPHNNRAVQPYTNLQTPVTATPPQKSLADSLGLSGTKSDLSPKQLGGDFFLGDEEVDYLVPMDTPTEQAREMLAQKLNELPGLIVGGGEKEIIVVFDPLCPVCHDLYRELSSDDPIAKTVKAKFLPANYFANNKSSQLASLYMLSKHHTGEEEKALKFLNDLVNGNQPNMEPVKTIPDEVISNVNKATMAVLQTGSRVPLVIFRDAETGDLELFSGKPTLLEISKAGRINKSG